MKQFDFSALSTRQLEWLNGQLFDVTARLAVSGNTSPAEPVRVERRAVVSELAVRAKAVQP